MTAELKTGHAILVFRTGDRFHALLLEAVEKIEFAVEVADLPDSPRIVLGVIDWRGTILPVVSMRRRLMLPERPVAVDDRLIIARSSRRRFALLVEEIVRVASISDGDAKAAEGLWQGMESIAGAVKMDSEIVLIHDLDSFLDEPDENALEAALGRERSESGSTGTLPRKSLAELSELVGARLGLSFPAERWDELARKIGLAAQGMGYRDLETFVRSVVSDHAGPGDLESLASCLTVGETFFPGKQEPRGSPTPRVSRHSSSGGGDRRLRIWSAGCASGEEPYTIAMMVNDTQGFRDWKVTIIGSDINQSFLAKAEAGLYSDWSFRGVPDAIKARFFRKVGKSQFEIVPEVRRMVDFEYLNLVGDEYPTLFSRTNAMDLILCRNVLMYFRPDTIQKVVGKLQRSLLDGGWLVVSPVESPLINDPALSTVQFPDAFLYRKHVPSALSITSGAPARERSRAERKSRPASRTTAFPPSASTSRPPSMEKAVKAYAQALASFAAAQYDACVSLLADPAAGLADDPKAQELLARAHANAGRLADAEKWCERAIRADKLNAVLRYILATVFIEQDRLERAVAALHRAIYIDPQLVVAHFTLGQLMLRMGFLTKARGSLANASALLGSCGAEEKVPEADGLSAGRLLEIVQSLLRERVEV